MKPWALISESSDVGKSVVEITFFGTRAEAEQEYAAYRKEQVTPPGDPVEWLRLAVVEVVHGETFKFGTVGESI